MTKKDSSLRNKERMIKREWIIKNKRMIKKERGESGKEHSFVQQHQQPNMGEIVRGGDLDLGEKLCWQVFPILILNPEFDRPELTQKRC